MFLRDNHTLGHLLGPKRKCENVLRVIYAKAILAPKLTTHSRFSFLHPLSQAALEGRRYLWGFLEVLVDVSDFFWMTSDERSSFLSLNILES